MSRSDHVLVLAALRDLRTDTRSRKGYKNGYLRGDMEEGP
jgi:hypothetical protein